MLSLLSTHIYFGISAFASYCMHMYEYKEEGLNFEVHVSKRNSSTLASKGLLLHQ